MLRALSDALGLRRTSQQAGAPPMPSLTDVRAEGSQRCQPAATESSRRRKGSATTGGARAQQGPASIAAEADRIPTTDARSPQEHAAALLAWLQGPGGRTGSILARELEELHREMCLSHDWEPIGWVAVARELRRSLGARKEYARVRGQRLRVYRIPPAARWALGPPAPLARAA